jgi:hypothetical protein
MEAIVLLILSISIIGIFIIFGFSHVKIENNVSSQFNERGHDLNSFMTKIKGNSSKLRL